MRGVVTRRDGWRVCVRLRASSGAAKSAAQVSATSAAARRISLALEVIKIRITGSRVGLKPYVI